MSKPTLTTIGLTGAGLFATWLATPTTPPTATPAPERVERAAPVRQLTAEDFDAQASKLREHLALVPLRASTRNPFRFGAPVRPASAAAPAASFVPPPAPLAPTQPSLSLSGVAERQTPQGRVRTAIISGGGQLYLVAEGDSVGGGYRVSSIESDAVVLRDDNGTETRLVLR